MDIFDTFAQYSREYAASIKKPFKVKYDPLNLSIELLDNCHKISFKSEDLRFEPASPNELQKKPTAKDLVFGKHFTDHWLRIPWSQSKGWEEPVICKLENMNLHPGAKV